MYHNRAFSGDSPDFWEENWAANQFEESVRFMSVDPLRPLFEQYLRSDSLMLEGGCGMGNYVAYYFSRDFNVVGLDFAQKALKTLDVRQPGLKLVAGDVSSLPFPDKTFDLYYSGGVVEHFEDGAERALNEARRVLKDTGILLISVPYHSPLRQTLLPFRKDDWKSVDRAEIENDGRGGRRFFQYAYRKREFKRMLADAGLVTIKTQGYAILWGIRDIRLFGNTESGEFAVPRSPVREEPSHVDIEALVQDRPTSLLKRLVVSEDSRVPVLGLPVHLMRWAAANMMMYVCKRK